MLPARPRVKICCIASIEEMRLAVQYGASAIGLVSRMPSGPGPICEDLIAQIAAATPPPIGTFLLTCEQHADAIIDQVIRCRTNTVQICDRLVAGTYAQIRHAVPAIKIVQVIHVQDDGSIEEAVAVAGEADAILLDSGRPSADIKELGGTGRRHDWSISRRIRDCVSIPIFLAGGLTPDNVTEAVQLVRPWGIDICSGLRTNGKLDEQKVCRFVSALSL